MIKRVTRQGSQLAEKPRPRRVRSWIQTDVMYRLSWKEYREKVRFVYDGPRGSMLATASKLSLHQPLGTRLLKRRMFDLRGARRILDVGSGAGQLTKPILRFADPNAQVVCFDLSVEMLRRARARLKRLPVTTPDHVAADLTRLPFEDNSFDCVTCGYVLEHLPDPRPGLAEIARILVPGGRFLLFATEDSFTGSWTSRLWCCRTFNREELRRACEESGLIWNKTLWFTKLHEALKAGGICAELQKPY